MAKKGEEPPMTSYLTIDQADVAGKRVLLRLDLNVPMEDGRVTDTTRIDRIIPSLLELKEKGAKIIILSHFGRPKEDRDPAMSLAPLAQAMSERLGFAVAFAEDCIGAKAEGAAVAMQAGDILLLENTRYHKGEEKNDSAFADALAKLGDLYINDAFSCAHRAHASTEGLAHRLPSFAGRAMQGELEALSRVLEKPTRPVAAIVGGAKISTKLDLLGNLIRKVDKLIIGGGMANTFLAANGVDVGKSLCERDLLVQASKIMAEAKSVGCEIVLPIDAVAATQFASHAPHRVCDIHDIKADEMMLDMGPSSIANVNNVISLCKTLLWNGPFGAFEIIPFDWGTVAVARHAAGLTKAGQLITVAGGGDTVSALNQAGAAESFTYISTAGGAFLEWLEGKTLPGVAALALSVDTNKQKMVR
jgi:phosphoglycerate kinase